MEYNDIQNIEKDKNILIIGAGRSIIDHKDKINNFIIKNNCVTIGINNISNFGTPDYHMWTNRQRFGAYGKTISSKSKLIIGGAITDSSVKKFYKEKYFRIKNEDSKKINYKDGIFYGEFRTCGVLSIYVAYIMGAQNIYIVGMDGYTLYNRKQVKFGKRHHHCYGKGHTDDATWKECSRKDSMVYDNLNKLCENGIKFSIITPTKFEKYYKKFFLYSYDRAINFSNEHKDFVHNELINKN